MEEVIVGVVGVLQFEVLTYRLKNEYNVDIRMRPLPYQYIRWIENEDIDVKALNLTSDTRRIPGFPRPQAAAVYKQLEHHPGRTSITRRWSCRNSAGTKPEAPYGKRKRRCPHIYGDSALFSYRDRTKRRCVHWLVASALQRSKIILAIGGTEDIGVGAAGLAAG